MNSIKLNFTDFWPGFDPRNNYFYDLLKTEYEVVISDNPDYLIYSVHGNSFLNYDCFRIFYCGENYSPNFFDCDFSFTRHFKSLGGRNFRLPHYVLYADSQRLLKPKKPKAILAENRKFCNMVVSNPHSLERLKFFELLSKYKQVDSGGRVMNNIGGPVANKLEFVKQYKFTIAFENSRYDGYTTEKIFEPMLVNSIPIYWGNKYVGSDFNERSFINVSERNFKEAVERIIELDQDDSKYLQILSEPYFKDNEINQYAKKENVLQHFDQIFERTKHETPVARRIKSKFRTIGYCRFRLEKQLNWQIYKSKKFFGANNRT